MELGVGGPEEEEEISMPIPIVSYAPPIIQEVSKLRLLGGTGAGAGEPAAAASTATAVTDAATTVTVSGEENTRLTSVPPAAAATSEQTTHADAAATTKKKSVRYRECLKNHAANIGGHAIDGCGEFMPSGQEGTLEALKCAACNCHRNFHRREVQGADHSCSFCYNNNNSVASLSRKLSFLRHGVAAAASSPPLISAGGGGFESSSSHEQQQHHEHDPHHGLHYPHPHHHHRHHMNIGFIGAAHPLSMLIPASQQHHPQNMQMQMQMRAPAMMVKKRFRTKFTQEQKDKMFAFAEKLGWRIQKHDEVAVQQICMELGVKRHVLKVWMHNNKNTLGKKIDST